MTKKRPDWDQFYLKLAQEYSKRATCPRASVGCVIVNEDRRLIAAGYNGSPPGLPHCDDVGCDIIDNHCKRVLHAESNALLYAAKKGVSVEGATAYLTITPCYDCFKLLVSAGIRRIVYAATYKFDDRITRDLEFLDNVTVERSFL